MSQSQLALCSYILSDFYGKVVEKVAIHLAKNGSSTVRFIAKTTACSVKEVKEALTVLILQNIAVFDNSEKLGMEYRVIVDQIIKRSRYEKFVYCTKKLHGDVAEIIIEELLLHGQTTQNQLVELTLEKLTHNHTDGDQRYTAAKVREMFSSLVQLHFICHCKTPSTHDSDGTSLDVTVSSHSCAVSDALTAKRKRTLDDSTDEGPANKRLRADSPVHTVSGVSSVTWRVDFDCIASHLRDQTIVDAVMRRVGKSAADIVSAILRLSRPKSPPDCTTTCRVSSNDILEDLCGSSKAKRETYSQWLKILSSDASSFVNREEGQGGGMYYINFRTGFTTLALSHIESVVTERFSLKGRRIFHLIYAKKQLEQKQIELRSMIRPKDAKELLYHMLEENFVSLTEIPKGSEYVTGKVIYLFSINLPQISKMLVEKCYRSMANTMCRRNHLLAENSQLLQQKAMLDAYVARLEAQGEEESVVALVKEQLTPVERKQLELIDAMTYRLDQAFIQTEETLFLLETYLKYKYMKT